MKGFCHIIILLVLVDSEEDALICNGDSNLHNDFIRDMYKEYPVPLLSQECDPNGFYVDEDYDMRMKACWGALVVLVSVCQAPLIKEHEEKVARCTLLALRRPDQSSNINLRIPLSHFTLPTTSYAGFYVNVSTQAGAQNDFIVKNSNSVLWKSFSLDKNSIFQQGCSGETKTQAMDCMNPILKLPDSFYTSVFEPGANTFLSNGGVSAYPDVAYSSNLLLEARKSSGRLAKVATLGSKTPRWRFACNGCTAPYFKIKVQWTKTFTDPIKGYSVKQGLGLDTRRRRHLMSFDDEDGGGYDKYAYYNQSHNHHEKSNKGRRLLATAPKPTYACWKRQIVIEEVFDSGVKNMRCLMPFTANQIRRKLAAAAAEKVSEELSTNTWGVSNNGAFSIPFPRQYSLDIVKCIQDGKVWKGFSDIAPGSCVACATQILSAKNNLVSRVCDMSNIKEAFQECCFSCRPKYMPSTGDDVYPPVCVASCKPGQSFHTVSKKCTLCPAGTYSKGGLGSCLTCHDLGYTNARIVAGVGCQACGLRAYADGAQCTACDIQEFVPPPAGIRCSGCSQRGYYLPESLLATACVACDYGTFMDRNSITCSQCPQDTYSPTIAASSCSTCPIGTLSIPNRSTCVPCAAIKLPLVEYFEPGCRLRCNPANSFLKTNARSVGGCGRCEDVALPIGFFSEIGACSVGVRCINGPENSFYTSSARYPSTLCNWTCKVGHNLVGEQCPACVYAANTFIPEKHQHTVGGCSYSCKPYVYRDSTLACDQPCKDLIQEHGNNMIFGRVRDYYTTTRPNYILGVCGSEETVPRSDIPFMRLGRWAYLSSSSLLAEACGNSLLNVGEECDDGNVESWDGCSSLCKIETDRYWDCDLIGVACLRDCGWKVSNIEDWGISLEGYVLPPCNGGICSCANLLYYDVVRLPVGQRGIWMSNNLFSCACGGNVLRTVPYDECTTINRGCRLCHVGQYHDDLLGMCITCGSACSTGFTAAANDLCNPLISTSEMSSSLSQTQREELIGCQTCPNPLELDLRFIQDDESSSRKCRFLCYKDTTGESQNRDMFCSSKTNSSSSLQAAECTGHCIKCSVSLNDLLLSESIVGGTKKIGYYPKGCSDVIGYEWAPCDSDSKPKYSSFSSTSLVPGARTGCEWVCNDGYLLSKGACVPCFQDTLTVRPCISGEQTAVCGSGKLACVPCDGPLPFPLQVWASSPPNYETCFADCEKGISWGQGDGGGCEECSLYNSCDMGELYVQCTTRSDSTCVPCSAVEGENMEYIEGGSCLTRCKSGYFLPASGYSNSQCEACVPLGSCKPENGVRPSSTCAEPGDRYSRPDCRSCDTALGEGETWSFGSPCVAVCVYGHVRQYSNNNTCVACRPSLCEKGQYGACVTLNTNFEIVTELTCTPCAIDGVNSHYATAGDCVTSCNEGFIENESGLCKVRKVVVVAPPVVDRIGSSNNKSVEETLVYPTRTQRHSGMK